MKLFKKVLAVCFSAMSFLAMADPQDVVSLFPLEHYNQQVSEWIKPTDPNYNKELLPEAMQQQYFTNFLQHYVGDFSPWNANHVNKILQEATPDDLRSVQLSLLSEFSNQGKTGDELGYGENFRPHDVAWIQKIGRNIDLNGLDNVVYQPAARGIAVDNLHARALPTNDVHYFSYKLAGQGYPFDNLQISALWAGTPVYTIAQTKDKAWSLVIAPEYVAWVESKSIASVSDGFVAKWTTAARNRLTAITSTQTSVVDGQGNYLFTAYIGSVFPSSGSSVLVPAQTANHQALIKTVKKDNRFATMPVRATPHAFARLIHSLIGRPYGWGSLYFFNDCSAETKSLLTPFGIWLPRHSSDQVKVGKMTDLTMGTPEQRVNYLMRQGHPFMNLIYLGGHVIMYVGTYPNPNKGNEAMVMTYQNLWGLSPNPSTRRAVIGQSVLFPMLLQYPEDPTLVSLANKKFFQVTDLTQLKTPTLRKPSGHEDIDLKSLMYPSLLWELL